MKVRIWPFDPLAFFEPKDPITIHNLWITNYLSTFFHFCKKGFQTCKREKRVPKNGFLIIKSIRVSFVYQVKHSPSLYLNRRSKQRAAACWAGLLFLEWCRRDEWNVMFERFAIFAPISLPQTRSFFFATTNCMQISNWILNRIFNEIPHKMQNFKSFPLFVHGCSANITGYRMKRSRSLSLSLS